MKGLILNIQRYSLHDGGGIRTIVFFKGCPLKCPWCSNPESISFKPEKVRVENKCLHCSSCSYDVEECPSGAITEFGKYMEIEEIIKEVLKDSVFYRTSNGGVTLSGGEVLSQPKFAIELLKELKFLGIHTAIETCGYGKKDTLVELAQYVDLVLFDLKIMDKYTCKKILGADIHIIKENLETLVSLRKNVIPRIPLIPGYTIDDKNIDEIIALIKSLNLKEVHLLPFHQYGSNKYTLLNKTYLLEGISPLSDTLINKVKLKMENESLHVILGGL